MKTISASRTVCIGCATSSLAPLRPPGSLGVLQGKADMDALETRCSPIDPIGLLGDQEFSSWLEAKGLQGEQGVAEGANPNP